VTGTRRGMKNGTRRRPIWCQKFSETDTAKIGLSRKKIEWMVIWKENESV